MRNNIDTLLIEDNDADADLIRHYLANPAVQAFFDDVSLTRADSLTDGFDALGANQFDAMLLDLGLPESTGIETLQNVVDRDPSVPIIVLTGLDDTDVAVEAIQVGAQDYLPKDGLDGDRLVRSLRYAIERYEQEQLLTRQNEQMDFFNSVLRHDMLNGLNVMMAQADMLATNFEDPDGVERAESISQWGQDITDLTETVRSILGTVTDDAGDSFDPVSLTNVVEQEVDRVQSVTDRVSYDCSLPDECYVRANDLLGDVVGNVLTNAVEHTEEETLVTVDAVESGSSVTLRIADDGPGVPADRREDLFDRGQKGTASTGTGFGLFFVSSMVESYGGTVRAEASDAGGAAFVLEFESARTEVGERAV